MKTSLKLLAVAFVAFAAAACSNTTANKMLEMADNVKVTCNPPVLEVVGNQVPVAITVDYPKDYFHPEAMLVVTPVLIYEGGQLTGSSYIYQGEKIKANNKVVHYAGGTVSEKMTFDYYPGMEKSYLELRSVAIYGDKKVELPAVKIADGCITTCLLADTKGAYDYKADNYQEVIAQTAEGQILYDVNSADVKNSQLNSSSIRDFKAALAEIQESERVKVTGTQIISYASPEGGEQLNAKLSDKRAASAEKAWKSISKGTSLGSAETKSIGQDWEGFQEAVSKSNIQDKDLILRVLSMYSDPAVRESEIKNMSQIYTEIREDVFPELRRARFITNLEYQNYSEEELIKIAAKRINILDEEALLRVAAITDDLDRKSMYYRLAAEKYNSERGFYNLGMVSMDADKPAVTAAYIDKLGRDNDPDVLNTKGVIEMRKGNLDKAAEYFNQSGNASSKINLGTIDLMNGKYASAAAILDGTGSDNEALADILAGKYGAAAKAIKGDDARSDYLRAIIAARQGDAAGVKSNLEKASAKDSFYKERAAKDIEFARFR